MKIYDNPWKSKEIYGNPRNMWKSKENAKKDDLIFIGGSTFVVAEVL